MYIKMKKQQATKTIGEAFDEFLKYCKVKNLSQHTSDFYDNCFKEFTKHVSEMSLTRDITEEVLRDYVLYLKGNGNLNDTSVNTMLRGVRAILYYFMKLGYMESFKIELIKADKKIKETYSDEELKILLKKPNLKDCLFTEYRDWVIVNFLISTGCRASTLVNIKIRDVCFEEGVIILQKTKNRKQQIIPLSKTLDKVLSGYLTHRQGDRDDYLFCSIYGSKLTVNALGHSIKKYNQRRGVMKTSVHLFRHTFAKKWILANGDIFRLQKILGHSSLEVVREYVNMFSDDLHKDFDRFNPLEQLSHSKDIIRMKR